MANGTPNPPRIAVFADSTQLREALAAQQYIASEEITTILYLARALNKPILAEGPAGVGKTELAKAYAAAAALPLIRLQCYEGLDESKALYEWEYAKQMLYTQLLRDQLNSILADAETLASAADLLAAEEDLFFSERFLLPRPLLRALRATEPCALLIDEVDRADAEFEAFLLEVLSDFQVSIPELGTLRAQYHPFVLLTSNNTRELSEALKRRCLYLYLDYPNPETELTILRARVPDMREKIARQIVEFVQGLRKLDLKKQPSIAETVDWAQALLTLNAASLDEATLQATLNVLLKHASDIQAARAELSRATRRRLDAAAQPD